MDNNHNYPDYEAVQEHIRRARVERAVALGNIIADVVHGTIAGLAGVARILQRGMQPVPRRPRLEG